MIFVAEQADPMRIDAGTPALFASQRPQPTAAERPAAPSFSAALAASQADGTRQTDFTRMTRQEMRDWVNAQLRSGEMSFDESTPFVAMTMRIPVDSGAAGMGNELSAESDSTRYDFTQKIRDGIEGALSRKDFMGLKMLESALQIVQRNQGRPWSVDARA